MANTVNIRNTGLDGPAIWHIKGALPDFCILYSLIFLKKFTALSTIFSDHKRETCTNRGLVVVGDDR